MAFISSPVAYPPTSSPSHEDSPRKRRRIGDSSTREPLRHIVNDSTTHSRTFAGFVADDDSEDEENDNASTLPALIQDQSPVDPAPSETGQIDTLEYMDTQLAEHSLPNGKAVLDRQDSAVDMSSLSYAPRRTCVIRNCSGTTRLVSQKTAHSAVHYERIVAKRSIAEPGRATKSYYGIDIHRLIDSAKQETKAREALNEAAAADFITETTERDHATKPFKSLLWTEKYRARKFTDLVGDERTHRSVLRWLKGWDPIVFPRQAKPKPKQKGAGIDDKENDRPHRKILLLTGPPGLGKTTLAHVCAKQAGYEVQEINASDERSSSVVKGRIRDMVATENVRSVESGLDGKNHVAAKPVCVIVDEVDGVVSGSGGSGEGGFIKALVDLLTLDQRNSIVPTNSSAPSGRKKKGDRFRMLRPLILVCNDVYHPSLRLLRQGTMAEIVHIRKPPIQMVAPRLQAIFAKEGVPCDSDGVRALCEAAWGVSNRKEDRSQNSGTGDGDMRSILVTGEWVAGKLRAAQLSAKDNSIRLSKRWLVQNVLNDLAHGGGAARSLGRGGSKEVVERIFLHNAGFPATTVTSSKSSSDFNSPGAIGQLLTARATGRNQTMDKLTQMIHASGEDDRIMSDVWTIYPSNPYQDDTLLTKPSHAYDWLHFHSQCSERVHSSQEWELAPYLSYPVLAFHQLFAGNSRNKTANTFASTEGDAEKEPAHPLTTSRAAYLAHEAQRANHATLTALHNILSHSLQRSFRGPEDLATDLVPYVLRILNPDVKPVVVGGSEKGIASVRKGSEKDLVKRSVQAMLATGVKFEKTRIEYAADAGSGLSGDRAAQSAGFIYRMEPCIDDLGTFGTAGKGLDVGSGGKVRYAVRQVLEQEHCREVAQVERNTRQRRALAGMSSETYDPTAMVEEPDPEALAQMAREEAAALAKIKADKLVKRDFFGRPIALAKPADDELEAVNGLKKGAARDKAAVGGGIKDMDSESGRVWVTFHEGYSNAVRKGITMAELLSGV